MMNADMRNAYHWAVKQLEAAEKAADLAQHCLLNTPVSISERDVSRCLTRATDLRADVIQLRERVQQDLKA